MWEMCVVSSLLIQPLFCVGRYLDVCFLIRIITQHHVIVLLSLVRLLPPRTASCASLAPLAHPSSLWGSLFCFLTPQEVWPHFDFFLESCIQTFQVAFVGN